MLRTVSHFATIEFLKILHPGIFRTILEFRIQCRIHAFYLQRQNLENEIL